MDIYGFAPAKSSLLEPQYTFVGGSAELDLSHIGRVQAMAFVWKIGEPGWYRTIDPLIKSQMLYH